MAMNRPLSRRYGDWLVGSRAALVAVTVALSIHPAGPGRAPVTATPRRFELAAARAPATPGYPVKVFFSKHPVSDDEYATVYAVRRLSPTLGVATYAIGQLITGPTPAEAKYGYYTELTRYYHGPSRCGVAAFKIVLNTRGNVPEPGTATLRFCRLFATPGVGTDARIISQVRATLLQFPGIKRVVILTSNGACFSDLSSHNVCLHPRRHLVRDS